MYNDNRQWWIPRTAHRPREQSPMSCHAPPPLLPPLSSSRIRTLRATCDGEERRGDGAARHHAICMGWRRGWQAGRDPERTHDVLQERGIPALGGEEIRLKGRGMVIVVRARARSWARVVLLSSAGGCTEEGKQIKTCQRKLDRRRQHAQSFPSRKV